MIRRPPISTLLPYTTLFRSGDLRAAGRRRTGRIDLEWDRRPARRPSPGALGLHGRDALCALRAALRADAAAGRDRAGPLRGVLRRRGAASGRDHRRSGEAGRRPRGCPHAPVGIDRLRGHGAGARASAGAARRSPCRPRDAGFLPGVCRRICAAGADAASGSRPPRATALAGRRRPAAQPAASVRAPAFIAPLGGLRTVSPEVLGAVSRPGPLLLAYL